MGKFFESCCMLILPELYDNLARNIFANIFSKFIDSTESFRYKFAVNLGSTIGWSISAAQAPYIIYSLFPSTSTSKLASCFEKSSPAKVTENSSGSELIICLLSIKQFCLSTDLFFICVL